MQDTIIVSILKPELKMAVRTILVLCVQALLLQCVFTQCIGRGFVPGLDFPFDGIPFDGLGCGCAAFDYPIGVGGAFPMSSLPLAAPIGLSVISDNVFEGTLYVVGEMPFISSVTLEGVLPSTGAGAINYACGNGVTAIVANGLVPDLGPPFLGPGISNYGYGIGCGNEIFY